MKINKLYICFLWVLMVCNYQITFCTNKLQEPLQKRQFDENFKNRYSSDRYHYEGNKIVTETPSGSSEYEDYKNTKDRRKEHNNSDSFSINFGSLNWLFYLAISFAILYLAYILFNEGGSGLFSSKQNKKLNNYEEITAQNIVNADINTLIHNAEKDNNFRLAIRYNYLLVLKNLSLKNYIKFEDDKTNNEYLNELNTAPFSNKFGYISYLYDYIWYGEFPVDIEQYKKAKTDFSTLLNQIK